MKTQRRRGGAPFRLKDPTQFIEAEIKKFLETSHKTMISHGRYGMVFKCDTPPDSSSFHDTLDPSVETSSVIVKISASLNDPDKAVSYDIQLVDNPKVTTTLDSVYLHDFNVEVSMQRKAYYDSIHKLKYPICPMILFSKSLPQDHPFIETLVKVDMRQDDGNIPPWSLNLIVMEMLSEDVKPLKQIYGPQATKHLFQMAFILSIDLLSLGIIHGDLHLNNVLVANDRVYLIDFGRSTMFNKKQQEKYATLMGKANYFSLFLGFYNTSNTAHEDAYTALTIWFTRGVPISINMYRPPLLTPDQEFLLLSYCPNDQGEVKGLTPEEEVQIFKRIKEDAVSRSLQVQVAQVKEEPPTLSTKRKVVKIEQEVQLDDAEEPLPPMAIIHQAVENEKTSLLGHFGRMIARGWDRFKNQAKMLKPSWGDGGTRRSRRKRR